MRPLIIRSVPLLLAVLFPATGITDTGNDATTIGCKKNATNAQLWIEATVITSIGAEGQPTCPLLEDKELRKLVNKFGAGTTFAFPDTNYLEGYSCLSSMELDGELLLENDLDNPVALQGYSESGQRLFPVPDPGEPEGQTQDVFVTSADGTLQGGAAMTAVHLKGEDGTSFDVLLDDHFFITPFTGDTEDFIVVGSRGDYEVSGRLSGQGVILSETPLIIDLVISGFVCLTDN